VNQKSTETKDALKSVNKRVMEVTEALNETSAILAQTQNKFIEGKASLNDAVNLQGKVMVLDEFLGSLISKQAELTETRNEMTVSLEQTQNKFI
jgi:hypothetical protein